MISNNIGVAPTTQITHVRNKKRNIQGRSNDFPYKKELLLKRLSLQLWTFSKKIYFLFKSFVKVELSHLVTINLFTIAENCMEK